MEINRELLETATKDIVGVLNNIYTKIDRSTRDTEDMTECDWELVGLFNKLVAINQRNLDVLYPERNAGSPKYLKFRLHNESQDVWVEDTDNKYEGDVALMRGDNA